MNTDDKPNETGETAAPRTTENETSPSTEAEASSDEVKAESSPTKAAAGGTEEKTKPDELPNAPVFCDAPKLPWWKCISLGLVCSAVTVGVLALMAYQLETLKERQWSKSPKTDKQKKKSRPKKKTRKKKASRKNPAAKAKKNAAGAAGTTASSAPESSTALPVKDTTREAGAAGSTRTALTP